MKPSTNPIRVTRPAGPGRPRRRSALAVAALLLTAVAATAATSSNTRSTSALDARVVRRAGGAIPVLPVELETLAPTDPLRAQWESFRAGHGGVWTVHLDERTALPVLLSGRGIEWFDEAAAGEVDLDEVDRRARGFLAANAPLLGAWTDLLELDRSASLRLRGDHWQLVYRERVDGVRVENARLDLHVVRGRLVMLGASHWARPTIDGVPALDAAAARGLLLAHLGAAGATLVPAGEPELTMIAVDPDPATDGEPRAWSGPRGAGIGHELVWRFRFAEPDGERTWAGDVDADDGTLRLFEETTREASVRGGVFPISTDGDCLTGGCEIAGFPMPHADIAEAGQPGTTADAFGNLSCSTAESTFETQLSGPYVNVADACGPVAETGDCVDGIDLGLKAGENCDVAPGASAGNTAAARTAYYHLNRIAEVARFYDPANAWLQSPLTVNVNVDSSCNANWTGSLINMYGAGGNCDNTGELASILVHEWGHGYDDFDGGGGDRPSEAYADIVAILTTRDSCMGRGVYNDGTFCTGEGDPCLSCTGFRDFDWTARQSGTPATPANFLQVYCPSDPSGFAGPCRREPHCESYVTSEAIYDLATRDLPAAGLDQDSAWQLVDRLWFVTRPGSGGDAYTCLLPITNSCGATSWYQRMRVADDDDGDLANGTPHAAAIFAAFKRHGLACGAAGDATNQSTSSCPALAAPALSRTVTPGGVELSWDAVPGADEYRVYRGELGCDRQQVPVASLPAGQTTWLDDTFASDLLRHYRVEALADGAACSGPVSACVGAPAGSRLQPVGSRVVDDGDGVPEPGETFALPVSLFNSGADAATSTGADLALVGPAAARVLVPSATWQPLAPNETLESDAPYFEVVVLESASCGDTLRLDVAGSAANSPPFAAPIDLPMGVPVLDVTETGIVPIPSLTASPVEVAFAVGEAQPIADLDLTLDIFHQDPTQLVVELTSPQGTTVRLHDGSSGSGHGIETTYGLDTPADGPGSMDDFVGETSLGSWTLAVSDLDGSGVTTDGYIRPRTLRVTAAGAFSCDPQTCAEPTPTAAPALSVDLVPVAGRLDLVLAWDAVDGAAGYHVLQSVDPAFGEAVTLLWNPAANDGLTLPDGARTTPALTYLQVRAVNACHQEGP